MKGGHLNSLKALIVIIFAAALVLSLAPTPASAENVYFEDARVEQAVRDALAKPTGYITSSEMLGITHLYVYSSVYSSFSLNGLQHAVNLQVLSVEGGEVSDLMPLSGLTKLTELSLLDNDVQDITPLSGLTNLRVLDLGGNSINNLAPLSSLANLEVLLLDENEINDISALNNLTALKELDISWNELTTVAALVYNSGMGTGDTVDISYNLINLNDSFNADDINTLTGRGVTLNYQPQLRIPPEMNTSYTTTYSPLDITFVDDGYWQSSITGIELDEEALSPNNDYSIVNGKITVFGHNFPVQGTYEIDIFAEGYTNEFIIHDVIASNGPGTITGTVTNWVYNPMDGLNLHFHQDGQDIWSGVSGYTDFVGNYSVSGLVAGTTYVVTADRYGTLIDIGSMTFDLDSEEQSVITVLSGNMSVGESGQLMIVLPEPKIKGRLTKGGIGVPNAWVYYENTDPYYYPNSTGTGGTGSGHFSVRTDSDGNFGMGLKDGNYKVTNVNYRDDIAQMDKWLMLNYEFSVSGGVTSSPLNLQIPVPNVFGSVYGINNNTYVIIGFKEVTEGPNGSYTYGQNHYYADAFIDNSGKYNFEIYLPSGQYSIGLNNGTWIDLNGEYIHVSPQGLITASPENQLVTVINNNLKINVPVKNVTGVVTDSENNLLSDAWLTIKKMDTDPYDWKAYKWAGTDMNGSFELYLSNGNYIITEVWYNGNLKPLGQEFSVTGGVLNGGPLQVVIREDNVQGIVKINGKPINESVNIGIRKANASTYYGYYDYRWITTDKTGAFSFSLAPGEYEVYGVSTSTQWQELHNKTFTVETDGLLAEGESVMNGKLIIDITKNVSGTVYRGGTPLAYAWIYFKTGIKDTAGTQGYSYYYSQTDANGRFGLDLPPGSYVIDGISTTAEYISWSQEFTAPVADLAVIIPGINLQGSVLDENGTPLPYAWLTIAPLSALDSNGNITDYSAVKYFQTDSEGKYKGTVPPGTYKIYSVSTAEKYVQLSGYTFTITGQESEPLNITVSIPSDNVRGILYDDQNQPVANAWIEIRPQGWTDYSQSRWVSTDANGRFSLILDDAGSSKNYAVTGISYSTYDEQTGYYNYRWVVTEQVFTVNAGQVTVVTVKIPGNNLEGHIYSDEAKQNPVAWASIAVTKADANADDWNATQWIWANENGYFSTSLVPGEYKVTGIYTGKGWMQFTGETFTISDSKTILDIVLPAPNVTGTVYGEDGIPLANTGIQIKLANTGADGYYKYWWVQTDQDGNFELVLQAGDYVVDGVSTPQRWIILNKAFTVSSDNTAQNPANIDVRVPASNITGTVAGAWVNNEAWVAVKPVDAADNDWSQTVWAMTENGVFKFALTVGTQYEVTGYYGPTGWVELTGVTFTVTEDLQDIGDITGKLNVSGNVTIGGQPAAKVTVGIKRADSAETKWVQTDESGNYKIYLDDGSYTVTYVVTDTEWLPVTTNNTITVDGAPVTHDIALE